VTSATHREYFLPRTAAGLQPIRCHEWSPPRDAGVTFVVAHGLGEHARALPCVRVADALVAHGHRVISYDQLGHGRSAAAPGKSARLPALVEDLRTVARHARSLDRTPLVALGLSMGAIVAIRACSSDPGAFDGVVAAAAPFGPVTAGRAAVFAASVLGRLLPRLPLRTGIDMRRVTDDEAALRAYLDDPLIRSSTRMGLASDLLTAVRDLPSLARGLNLPALFLHGSRDVVAPWPDDVVATLQGGQRVVRLFERGHHNLFLDRARADVFDAILQWAATLRSSNAVAATDAATHPVARIGVGVIVLRGGRVLLGLRRGSRGSGTWALPGGHLEPGESVEQCAVREAREETGLEIRPLARGPTSEDLIEGVRYVTHFVVARSEAGEPEAREPEKCPRWSWFRWSELPEPLFQPLATVRKAGYIPTGAV
jgi:8-oxo-dGTP diphosphatase